MFTKVKHTLKDGRAMKYQLKQDGGKLSYGEFLSLLVGDEEFRSFFIWILSDVPFKAYHWETPPARVNSMDQPFEFVVTDSPGMDLWPHPGPFRQYFNNKYSDNHVAVFNNLGNDAKLIAPEPVEQGANYSHIGVFIREAPAEQQHALWKRVGQVTREQVSNYPLWLNTAGGGVAWLHVRLDSSPKYYLHNEYKSSS